MSSILTEDASFPTLATETRTALSAQLGEHSLQEFYSLSQEADPTVFCDELLLLAQRLEDQDKLDWALKIYASLGRIAAAEEAVGPDSTLQTRATNSQSLPMKITQSLRKTAKLAKQRMQAILGQGEIGARFEFLLKRFVKDATNYRTIIPMMAGSFVGQLAEASMLGRLTGTVRSGWMATRWVPRAVAAVSGYLPEALTFGLLNRAMVEAPQGGLGKELVRSALSIGALKLTGFLGNQAFLRLHGYNEIGKAVRLVGLAKFNQFVIPQLSIFGGMLLSHKLEEWIHLRAKTDDATTVTDTLTSMLSMEVGSHLGRTVLGSKLAHFLQEVEIRRIAKRTEMPREKRSNLKGFRNRGALPAAVTGRLHVLGVPALLAVMDVFANGHSTGTEFWLPGLAMFFSLPVAGVFGLKASQGKRARSAAPVYPCLRLDTFREALAQLAQEIKEGETVSPQAVANRAYIIYCKDLSEQEKPHPGTFRNYVSGLTAIPEVMELLDHSPLVRKQKTKLGRR